MRRGIICICLSAFGFALMAMFVRLADEVGAPLPAVQKAFFRNLVAIAIALPAFLRARGRGGRGEGVGEGTTDYTDDTDLWEAAYGRRGKLSRRDWVDLILRSGFGTLGVLTNFYALSHIPIGDGMALNKTAPFFTVVFSWLLLGEAIGVRQIICILLAFAGAMLVVKPGFSDGFSIAGMVGLSSGLCAGIAYAILHRLGRSGVNSAFIIFFFSVFSCVACLPFIVLDPRQMTAMQMLALGGAGAGAALGQFGITWAYRFAEPRQIAAYDYLGIVFAAALGFVVFGQMPDGWSLGGIALIIAMGCVLFPRG